MTKVGWTQLGSYIFPQGIGSNISDVRQVVHVWNTSLSRRILRLLQILGIRTGIVQTLEIHIRNVECILQQYRSWSRVSMAFRR